LTAALLQVWKVTPLNQSAEVVFHVPVPPLLGVVPLADQSSEAARKRLASRERGTSSDTQKLKFEPIYRFSRRQSMSLLSTSKPAKRTTSTCRRRSSRAATRGMACWLTRRVALSLLERAPELLATTPPFRGGAAPEFRSEIVAFERDAAIATTAEAMRDTPSNVLETSVPAAELMEHLMITPRKGGFSVELRGDGGGAAVGVLTRAELHRVLLMLQAECVSAAWLVTPIKSPTPAITEDTGRKRVRH